jgi:hypothetical protein
MKRIAVTVSAAVLVLTNTGWSATLGTYEFAASSSEVPTVANGSFSFATVVGLNDISSPGHLGLSGFTTGNSDLGQYVQFTIAPDPGYTLTMTGFQWTASRDSQGPQSVYFRLFEGTNPANNDPALHAVTYKQGTSAMTLTYPSAASSEDGLTLRLYGFSAGSSSGTLSLERLSLFGEIGQTALPPVPEPGTAALVLAGAGLYALRRVRKNR